jgi:hypothetical protein
MVRNNFLSLNSPCASGQADPVQAALAEGSDDPPGVMSEAASTSNTALTLPFAGLVVIAIWASVCLILVLRLGLQLYRMRQQVRSGKAVNLDGVLPNFVSNLTTPAIRIVQSADCRMPLATGILKSVILLPNDFRDWSVCQLRAVLAHASWPTFVVAMQLPALRVMCAALCSGFTRWCGCCMRCCGAKQNWQPMKSR